jgi:hypothetical protein
MQLRYYLGIAALILLGYVIGVKYPQFGAKVGL